jgi:hypothetical protein
MYFVGWKGFLPVGKVHETFQLTRYMYLAGWKETLPAGKVYASPAGRKPFQPLRMCLASHLKGGYPRIPASGFGWCFPQKKQLDIRMHRGQL